MQNVLFLEHIKEKSIFLIFLCAAIDEEAAKDDVKSVSNDVINIISK